jgi:molybdenum cofactor cytidylyltransferase
MGFNKLQASLDGVPIVRRVVRACTSSSIEGTVVVLGCRPDQLVPFIRDEDVDSVVNEDWERGMLSTFQRGVRHVLSHIPEPGAVLLVLGDVPLIDAACIDALVAAWHKSDALLAVPVHEGRRGHPLLVDGSLLPEVMELGIKESMRDLVGRHADDLLEVELPQSTLVDVDYPEDLEMAGRLARSE